jgi:hypothetical protein
MIAPVMPEKNRKAAVSSPAQRCSLPNIALIAQISFHRDPGPQFPEPSSREPSTAGLIADGLASIA